MPDAPDAETVVDLAQLAADASPDSSRAWSVEAGDMGANLVVLQPGQSLEGHVNRDADLLIVGVSGTARVDVDDRSHTVGAGVFVHVPKGTWRQVTGVDRAAFLTVHRQVVRSRRLRRAMPAE